MRLLRSLDGLNIEKSLVTIGSFDGVHLGHQNIIRQLVAESRAIGAESIVITFFPHPALVLRGIQTSYYLTTLENRVVLLGELGVDTVISLTFNQALAALTAEEFMSLLHKHLGVRQLWVGQDFALGKNRQGTFPVLQEIGKKQGYTVHQVEPVTLEGQVVSSSLIRGLISRGDVKAAARFLGRPYAITGKVVHGDGRGHGLGIPTANMDLEGQALVPENGVYITWALIEGARYRSVTSIGYRPTFEENTPHIARAEPHLLDFDDNIYGKQLTLEFVDYIRPEIRFSGKEALLEQIRKDILKTREVLSNE